MPAFARRPSLVQARHLEVRNAIGLELLLRIARTSGITVPQLAKLLGVRPQALRRWRVQALQRRLPLPHDTVERTSNLLGVWVALVTLFPTTSNRGTWLHSPNSSQPFSGSRPLTFMLTHGLAGIRDVRRHLDAACA
jgi:hypothetical protein